MAKRGVLTSTICHDMKERTFHSTQAMDARQTQSNLWLACAQRKGHPPHVRQAPPPTRDANLTTLVDKHRQPRLADVELTRAEGHHTQVCCPTLLLLLPLPLLLQLLLLTPAAARGDACVASTECTTAL